MQFANLQVNPNVRLDSLRTVPVPLQSPNPETSASPSSGMLGGLGPARLSLFKGRWKKYNTTDK